MVIASRSSVSGNRKGRVMCRESFRSQKKHKSNPPTESCLSADNVTICLAFRDLSALLSFPSPEADNARAEKSEADLRPASSS